MTRLLLVRHAHAGDRGAWAGDDDLRPLTPRGAAQAETLVGMLAPLLGDDVEILTSPAVRCAATVAPLARHLGVVPVTAAWLAEGAPTRGLAARVAALPRTAVWCSHGDVIPALLLDLAEDGLDLGPDPRCRKGSVWVLEVTDGAISARYLEPPRG